MNNLTPETIVRPRINGGLSIITRLSKCSVEADILLSSPSILELGFVCTDPDHRRKGLATAALLHTVETAQQVTGGDVDTIESAIINPAAIPLLDKTFAGQTEWFAEQDDFEARQNQIDRMLARILCTIRQEQMREFEVNGVDAPTGFDAGVYGIVRL
jgi:hypothetical protein